MATAILQNGPTLIHACDAATDATTSAVATGNVLTAVTDFKVHGIASLGFTWSTNASKQTCLFTTSGTVDISATPHFRVWFNFGLSGMLETFANNGVTLLATDGTNQAEWTVAGSDTYGGGWVLLQVDMTRTPDIGTAPNLTALTAVGIHAITHPTAVLRNATNTWIDNAHFSNGYEFYGGTTVDKVTMSDVWTADVGSGWGIVQKYNGVYFVNSGITIGDSTGVNDTYVDFSDDVVVFTDELVDANLYKIDGTGNATGTTDISFSGMVIKSVGSRFSIDMTSANLDALSMVGNTIGVAGTIDFKAGQSITGNVFDNCYQIDPSTSTFEGNTLSNYSEAAVNGALLWPGGTTVNSCTFNSCDEAIEITQTVGQTFDNLKFSGNTNDVHLNNGGVSIDISKSNGSDPTSYTTTGGGVVSFVASSSLYFLVQDEGKVPINLANLYINDDDTGAAELNTTTNVSGVVSTSYAGGVTTAVLRIRKYGYKYFRDTIDISSDINRTITLVSDPQQT